MTKPLRINFIGSFTTGYVGETSDETHLARELESLGHFVQQVPRDIWKATVDGETSSDWEGKLPIKADINLVAKWHHFNNGEYIDHLKMCTGAPVFYWTWDHMDYDNKDGFHYRMAKAADLLLTNDGLGRMPSEIKWHYFPFDVSDRQFDVAPNKEKYLDVSFFGSKLGQGDRVEWLTYLKDYVNLSIFSWNWQDWQSLGFTAYPAVYGKEFSDRVNESKVVIGFNVNDHTWGYWSNRVGKVLTVGGFLLQRYVPGMELFLRDGAAYFSSKEEMVEKVKYYLEHEYERNLISYKGYVLGRDRFTSKERVAELAIVMERYLAGGFND